MSLRDAASPEGDPLGTSGDRTLIHRAASFLAPHRRRLIMAALLVFAAIGLELAMPFITRTAVDRYLVPYFLRLDARQIPPQLKQQFSESTTPKTALRFENHYYVAEDNWSGLDPALASLLRQSGAVDTQRWYRVTTNPATEAIVARHPRFFIQTDVHLFISEDDLQNLPKHDLKELRAPDARALLLLALLYAATAISLLAVSFFYTICIERTGQQIMMELRVLLYGHVLRRSLLFFTRNPVGKLVTRINNDTQGVAELFCNLTSGLFKDIFLFAGITIAMFAMHPRLAAVCLLIVPFMAVIASVFARTSRRIFRRLKGYTGKINTLLQETLAGLTALKLIGAQAAMLEKLVRANTLYYRAGLAQVKMFAVFSPLMELVGSLAVAMILWHGGGSVLRDRISLGTLVAFLGYMQMLLVPIRDLAEKYSQLQGALTSAERIVAVLDDPDTLPVMPRIGRSPGEEYDIRFESVDFSYRPELHIFKNFYLDIPWGQTVALVGPSGGGKSTLVNLLLRLYDPQSGRILLGGRGINTFSSNDLAHRIALVSQELVVLAASIKDNITLGRPGVTREMLNKAVDISGVESWAHGLVDGIDTRIGEGGRPLSQGQYQMLSLARALAGDPRILILDEAFSQIDPDSERLIASKLPVIMSGRTCITIAHRISTARHSQRILVMRKGRIVEDGDHDSLMAHDGIYANMVSLDNVLSVNQIKKRHLATKESPGCSP